MPTIDEAVDGVLGARPAVPGNIDLNNRPRVKNPDGSISTVRSMGVNIDGREVLLPTVSDDGKLLNDQEAIALYRRTGRHLGMFDSVAASNAYAEQLHRDQERQYAPKRDPIADAVGAVIDGERTQRRATMFDAVRVNPDQAAKAKTLERETGTPSDVILRNLQDVQLQAAVEKYSAQIDAQGSNTLRKYYATSDFARMSHDDLNTLLGVDAQVRQYGELKAWNGPKPTTGSVLYGLAMSPIQGFKAASEGLNMQMTDLLEGLGVIKLDDVARKDMMRKMAQASGASDFTTPDFESSTARGIYGGGASLLRMAPGLALSAATRSPTPLLASAGLQTEAESYAKYRTRGATPGMAAVGAGFEGAVEVGTELLPTKFLTSALGKAGMGEFVTGLLAREIPGEQLATLLQDAADTAIANPDKTWAQYLNERPAAAYETLIATVTQSAVMGGVSQSVRLLARDQAKMEESERTLATFESLLATAGQSRLRERSPETFAQFVQEAAEQGGAPTAVYVDARALTDALNQAGITDEQLAQVMPDVPAQMANAFDSGGVVEIPIGQALAAAPGTPLEQVLLQNARLDPEGLSRVELDEATKQADKFIEQAAEAIRKDAETKLASEAEVAQIRQTIAEQLNTAGRFRPEANQTYATMVGAFYSTMAQRLGVTPAELYARYPLRVTGEMQAGALEQAAQAVRAEQTMAKSPVTGKPEFALFDAEGNRLGTYRSAATADEAVANFNQRRTVQSQPEPQVRVEAPQSAESKEPRSNWKIVRDQKFTNLDEDDGYLYHVTSSRAASDIIRSGLVPNSPRTFGNAYAGHSASRVFLTERSGVSFWREKVGQNLQALYDRPPAVTVVRIPKDKITAQLQPDKAGSADARRPAYYAEGEVLAQTDGKFKPVAQQTRATFSPEQMLIALGPNADYSSFLHEMGHAWLEILNDIATQPGAPEQIAKDWQTTLDWFGATAEQWAAMTLDQKRPYHERWAESTEQYFFEGKAPSTELRGVFDRFRTWLMSVYKSLKQFLAMRAQTPGGQAGAGTLAQSQQVDEDTGLPLNADGTVTVYHHTSAANADAIRKTGRLKSAGEPDVYVTTRRETDTGYGDTAVPVRVKPELLQLDDEFPDGRMDFRIDTGKPGGSVRVQVGEGELAQSAPGTDAFAKWFGDSKVVDAEGKPLVVYHGTNAHAYSPGESITTFNTRPASGRGGAFFTDSPRLAAQYGERVYDTYLSMQNPLVVYADGKGWTTLNSKSRVGGNVTDKARQESERDAKKLTDVFAELAELFDEPTETVTAKAKLADAKDLEGRTLGDLPGLDGESLETDAVVKAARRLGYDGVIFKNVQDSPTADAGYERVLSDVFAVFNPEQIKSATGNDGTFDANDPSILSQSDNIAGPLNLTDEIRAVMDRLLATDEQITEMERVREFGLLFKSPEEAGMTPEQWAAYTSADERAHAEALTELSKRSLRDMGIVMRKRMRALRDVQRDMAEKRKAVEEEADAIVAKEPVYQAMRWLKKGEMTTPEGEEVKVTDGFKLDAAAVDAIFPESMPGRPDMAKLRGMTLKKGGLDPAIVADMFGFRDGAHLITSIVEAFPQADQVQGLTDQMMLERYGDLSQPRGMERAADEAVHNENRARVLAAEMATISAANNARAPGQNGRTVNAMVQAAKLFAERLVESKKVKDLKPQQHTAAETRAARAAEKALAKGDTQAVIQAKRDQLLNFHAAKATNEARIEAAKVEAFFKKIATAKDDVVGKTRDLDVVKAAQAILAAYGVGTKGKAATEYLAVLEKNDAAMFAALKPSIDAALASAKPVDELTMAELRALNEELQVLWYLAKRSRQMEVDGNLLDIQEAADDLKARLVEIGIPDSMPGETSAITPAEQRALKLKGFLAAARRVESWAQAKDGAQRGPFRRLVWEPVREAADRYRADKAKTLKAFKALLDPIAPTLTKRKIAAPELGYTFGEDTDGVALAEILHAVLHTGNESNKRKLLLGRKWATENEDGTLDTRKWDAFVQRMVAEGVLQPAHFDFAQGVWDLLESTKPLAQKAHRDAFGRYFNEVTADVFTDPFGVKRRGGYVPAQADARIVSDQATRRLMEDENASMQFAFPTTSKGFTKGRVEYNRPLLLDLRGLTQHIDKVLLFSHLENPVRDARKLLTNKAVAYGLNRIDPVAFDAVLTPWLNRAAKQQVETPVAGDAGLMRFFSALRRRAGMAAMFGNVANAVQQLAGFSMAAVRVKPSRLASATAQYVAGPREMTANVAAKSTYMATRLENEVANMSDAINDILLDPSVYEKSKAFLAKHAYFVQSAVDNVMGPIIWTGAYNQALEQGMEDKDAVRYADSAIRETQGSTAPEDISRIETGNAFVRLFTQFAGYFNMQANLLGTEFKVLARDLGLRKGLGRGLYVLTFGYLVNAWVAEGIMQAFKGGPDDDDKDGDYLDNWLAQVFGWSLVRNTTAMIPVAGPMANALINTTNSKPYDDRISTSPAISMLESAAATLGDTKKIAEGKDVKPSKVIRDVATLISMTTGVPANAAAKPLGYLADVQAGRVTPTSAADAARGALTGAASPESKR